MIEHDMETGEVMPNGRISQRAMSASAQARVMMDRDRTGYGATGLHFAIWQAVKEMPVWIKSEAQGNRAKYAPLKDILHVVRPLLEKNGIRIRQGSDKSWGMDDGGAKGRLVPVYTDLIHVPTGEYERTQIEIPITRLDPQSMGSALTYGRRYTLIAALGLATDEADDDGARAMPVTLTDKPSDSAQLQALQDELKAIDSLDKLNKWGSDGKVRSRINELSEGEHERLRIAYGDKREALSSAE